MPRRGDASEAGYALRPRAEALDAAARFHFALISGHFDGAKAPFAVRCAISFRFALAEPRFQPRAPPRRYPHL